MRVWGGLAVMLSLCACDASPIAAATTPPAPDTTTYDYRYAYRVPTQRIKGVQDSHAAGCDRLGAARCRVTAMHYAAKGNAVGAALALKIDPAIARAFGQAATRTVIGAHGVLLDSDATAGTRTDTVLAQLRAALSTADAAARKGDTLAAAKAVRLHAALAAIAEVDPAAAASTATTPLILTYASGAPEPSLAAAGPALVDSLGGLAVILAGVGPWLLLLLGGALLLRRLLAPKATRDEAELPLAVPLPEPDERSNVIRRWFHREPEKID